MIHTRYFAACDDHPLVLVEVDYVGEEIYEIEDEIYDCVWSHACVWSEQRSQTGERAEIYITITYFRLLRFV